MMRPFLFLAITLIVHVAAFTSHDSAHANCVQESDVEVGDVIEFEFMGKTRQAAVTKITGTGWPWVRVEWNGREVPHLVPEGGFEIVESNSNSDDDSDSSGDASGEVTSEMRTWTDKSGKFKIEAKMVSLQDDKIELEKKDGRIVTLPLAKLSKADQSFLEELKLQNSAENPFAGGVKKGGKGRKRKGSSRSKGPTATKPGYDANELYLSDPGWNVTPDAAKMTDSAGNRILTFASKKNEHAFHDKLAGIQLSGNKKWMASCISNPFESTSQVVRIDLDSGRALPPAIIKQEKASLIGISTNGKIAATIDGEHGGRSKSLDFWTLGDPPNKIFSWKTASFHDRDGFAPKSGLFLEQSRLLTIGRRIVLWDCETAAALYSYSINEKVPPAFSPNRNQIAVSDGELIYIVGTRDGEALGMISPPEPADRLAFSLNGRFLAGWNRATTGIWIWDLKNDKLIQELSAPLSRNRSFEWVGNKYLLVNDSDLVDVALRAKVWKYNAETSGEILASGDGRFWFSKKNKAMPFELPHKDLAPLTSKFVPDELLVLKPGASVAVQFKLPFSPGEQKQIREEITDNLQAVDVSIDKNSELVLIAEVRKGKPETVDVSDFFSGPFNRRGSERITYTPNYASFRLEKNGTRLWEKANAFKPMGIIHLNSGENAQKAANRICTPKPSFFSSTKFPKYIAQLPGGKPLGVSKLTSAGIK